MKRFVNLAIFMALALSVAACGKTEFGGEASDQSVSEALGDLDSTEAYGEIHTVADLLENPALAGLYGCGNKNDKKVLICHVPPGNAAAAHTICIGAPAVSAHLHLHEAEGGEHDTLGACPAAND